MEQRREDRAQRVDARTDVPDPHLRYHRRAVRSPSMLSTPEYAQPMKS